MEKIAFHIGSRPIYWYGVMVALAFLAGVVHWTALGRRERRPPGFGSDLGFWIMLSGILGARLAYVAANWADFAAAPLEIVRIDQGGLIYYGGFLGACACLAIFARRHREPLWSLADFAVTALPLAHALGRIGCFLNGCCYGSITTVAWCVPVEGACRHPVQLYEAGLNLALYFALLWYYPRRRKDGAVFALYLLTYPPIRFLLEFFRGDARQRWLLFDAAQDISLVLFAIGVLLWFGLPNRRYRRHA
jgi:phosphatidylglycerol:prolipoprotein diacylglycerol transferase